MWIHGVEYVASSFTIIRLPHIDTFLLHNSRHFHLPCVSDAKLFFSLFTLGSFSQANALAEAEDYKAKSEKYRADVEYYLNLPAENRL